MGFSESNDPGELLEHFQTANCKSYFLPQLSQEKLQQNRGMKLQIATSPNLKLQIAKSQSRFAFQEPQTSHSACAQFLETSLQGALYREFWEDMRTLTTFPAKTTEFRHDSIV